MNNLDDLGRSTKKLLNLYRNLNCKLAAWESHSRFLNDCWDHHLVPVGLRLGLKLTTEREKEWMEKAQTERLRVTKLDAHDSVFRTKARIRGVMASLERQGTEQGLLDWIKEIGRAKYEREKNVQRARKEKKFNDLLFESGPLTYTNKTRRLPTPTDSTVINISSSPLTVAQRQVLTLGQKYAPAPKALPLLEMAAKSQWIGELATTHADRLGNTGEGVANFLNEAEKILTSASNATSHKLPVDLDSALHTLRKDEEKVFVRADKAKSIVALDKADYNKALLRTLEPPIYEEVAYDPAERFAKDFNTTHLLTAFAGPAKKGEGNRMRGLGEAEKKLYHELSQTHGRCGAVYAMVKTHKYPAPPKTEEERRHWIDTLKVRPINPGYRSVDYNLSKHLTACLQAIPRPPHSIAGPDAALDMLNRWNHMAEHITLVSLDIVAMFPSINVQAAIPLIREQLEANRDKISELTPLTPDALATLLKLCIENTHSVVQDGDKERFFVQKKGLAMGKAFSPCVADLVVGEWEREIKEVARLDGGHIWDYVRYADDYLILWQGTDEQLQLFVNRLNRQDASIQVEVEREANGKLPFLDILIHRTDQGFSTSVYRKPSNSGQVTPFASFTHPQHLKAAIKSDAFRAWRYSTFIRDRQKEVKRIEATYVDYGFPLSLVKREIKRCFASLELKKRALPAPPTLDPTPRKIRVSFPYTGNSYHHLKRSAAKLGIQMVAKPINTIASLVSSKAKHKLSEGQQSGVVYAVRCDCTTGGVNNIYIGESERELATRIKEHKDGWMKGAQTSAFGGHKNCQPRFEEAKILARQSHRRLRLLYESAYIRVAGRRETVIVSPNDASINRNSGTMFDQRFLPIVQEVCKLPPTTGDSFADDARVRGRH